MENCKTKWKLHLVVCVSACVSNERSDHRNHKLVQPLTQPKYSIWLCFLAIFHKPQPLWSMENWETKRKLHLVVCVNTCVLTGQSDLRNLRNSTIRHRKNYSGPSPSLIFPWYIVCMVELKRQTKYLKDVRTIVRGPRISSGRPIPSFGINLNNLLTSKMVSSGTKRMDLTQAFWTCMTWYSWAKMN